MRRGEAKWVLGRGGSGAGKIPGARKRAPDAEIKQTGNP